MDGWQLRMFEAVEQVDVPVEHAAACARKLLLHTYLQAVLDAREGDAGAKRWLNGEGREIADAIGLPALARLSVDVLIDSANKAELMGALGEQRRHCRGCAFLSCADGRCSCSKGMWAEQGRREDYAEATVLYDTKGFLKPCNLWEGS